jgi:hypothetical protein
MSCKLLIIKLLSIMSIFFLKFNQEKKKEIIIIYRKYRKMSLTFSSWRKAKKKGEIFSPLVCLLEGQFTIILRFR